MFKINTIAFKIFKRILSEIKLTLLLAILINVVMISFTLVAETADPSTDGQLHLLTLPEIVYSLQRYFTLFYAMMTFTIISEEFRSDSVSSILSKVSRCEYVLGIWLGLIGIGTLSLFLGVFAAMTVAIGSQIEFDQTFWFGVFQDYALIILLYSSGFFFAFLFKRPGRWFIFAVILAIVSSSDNDMQTTFLAKSLKFIHYISPSIFPNTLTKAFSSNQTNPNTYYSFLVSVENILYALGLVLLTLLFFNQRDIAKH